MPSAGLTRIPAWAGIFLAGSPATYLTCHTSAVRAARSRPELSVTPATIFRDRDPEIVQEINQNLSDSYTLLNARIDKYFWDNQLQLSFQINNLLDENYSDIMGAKMPGRWILGGLTWNFHR